MNIILTTKRKALGSLMVAASFATIQQVSAFTTIYLEDFEDVAAGGGSQALSTYGWSSIADSGTDLSDSTSNPARVIENNDLGGDYRTFIGSGNSRQQFITTNEVNFDQADYEDDLTFSFLHLDSTNDPDDGYRLAFQIGGSWYLQDGIIAGSSTATNTTIAVNSLTFFEWTGAPTASSGFTTNPTGTGSALIAGQITGIGLLIQQDDGTADTFRFDDVTLAATAIIPEPATLSLSLVGLLGLFGVRRRA